MNRIILILAFVLFTACNTTQPTKESNQLYIDQSLMSDKNSAAGWLAYGVALAAWEPVYLDDGSLDYFDREVSARNSAAKIWKELKQNDSSKSDAALDILEKVSDAGFMEEYLWVYLKEERWKDPGTLELEKFYDWAKVHLANHVPVKNPGVSLGD